MPTPPADATPELMQRDAWLRVLRAPGLGGIRIRQLLEHFGSIQAVASANGQQLKAAGAPAAAIQWLLDPDLERIAADHAWQDLPGQHLLNYDHEDFHAMLLRAPRAPAALFIARPSPWSRPGRIWFTRPVTAR